MLDARMRRLIDPPLARMADLLAATALTANAVTLAGFGLGLLAMAAIAGGFYLTGLGLLLANRLADGLDGALARRRAVTDLGGFLDIVLDFIVYSGVVVAFALADPPRNALAACFLVFSFTGTGSSFLAFAVMAARRGIETEARGRKSLYYLGGLTEGTETIALFVLCCLFPAAFPVLALVFGALCWLTTLARVLTAWRLLG
ncbi:CDP-alcohol phosphatidyltransferase family protein [Geminicoccaceae bacterium 1502E]|nr:CDP-alcohol phosphatidyltransferase family protein [Geminicoccaceae bacterium 1502E]